MDFALAAFVLAPGLAVGSFLNVLAARVPLRRSVVSPGSACMACGTSLAWYDNIPLASFVVLSGRCILKFGLTWDAAIGAFFCAALVAVSATDIERRVIPNAIVLPAEAVAL